MPTSTGWAGRFGLTTFWSRSQVSTTSQIGTPVTPSATGGIPIVVVSADALAQQIAAAFEAGCTHYLTKPVSVSELLSVVDDLLERMDTRFG